MLLLQAGRRPQHAWPPREPSACSGLVDLDVLEIARLVVDADLGCGDPGSELAPLPAGLHKALDEVAVRLRGDPLIFPVRPLGIAQDIAFRGGLHIGELADLSMEGNVREFETEVDAGLLDHLVPA